MKNGRAFTVYIAGPYSHGDVAENIRAVIKAAEAVIAAGYLPFLPHLSHLWHLISPHELGYWLDYDLAWLERCDAMLRLPGFSPGADREEEFASQHGIPVVYSVLELERAALLEEENDAS